MNFRPAKNFPTAASIRFFALSSVMLATACEPPAEPLATQEARQRALDASDRALTAVDRGWNFAASLQAFESIADVSEMPLFSPPVTMIGPDTPTEDGEVIQQNVRQWTHRALAIPSLKRTSLRWQQRLDPRARASAVRQADDESSLAEIRAQVHEFLAEKVFVEANVEKVEGGTTYYRLPAEALCTYDEAEVGDELGIDDFATPSPAVDENCKKMLEEAKVRLAVQEFGDEGVRITVQVGDQRHECLTLELEPNRIAEIVDFAQLKAALEVLAKADDAEIATPARLDGVQRCELTVPSDHAIAVECSLLEDFRLELDDEGKTHALTIQAADPLVRVEVDAQAQSMASEVAIKNIDYSGPALRDKNDEAREIAVHVDGLGGKTTVKEGDSSLTFVGLNAGRAASTFDFEGNRVARFDLNAEHDRRFDVTITPDEATGSALWQFSPALTLSLAIDQSAMVEAFEIDPAAIETSYDLVLDGDAKPELWPYSDASGSPVLKVVRGKLTIRDQTGMIEAEANQCVLQQADDESSESPVSNSVVGECPEPAGPQD